jgi:predicted DNA-binding antitoxin AbrB/MazE fold protein
MCADRGRSRLSVLRYNEPRFARMSTTVKAVYEDGVFKPKEPVSLQEHAEVEVLIPNPAPSPVATDDNDTTGWKAIDELIGSVRSGLTDVAERHDEYLYGDPHD